MHSIWLIAGIVCLAIWVYLLMAHGGFWKVWRLLAPAPSLDAVDGTVAVVIPARDEQEVIASSIRSLLQQKSVGSIHIFVVDDHSSDETAQAARQAARGCGLPDSISVICGSDLPAGWTGKLWAAQQGIQEASKMNPGFSALDGRRYSTLT